MTDRVSSVEDVSVWPVSTAQAVLLGCSPPAHVVQSWEWNSPPDDRALQMALDALLERHSILRTGFAIADGDFVGTTRPLADLKLQFHDISHLDSSACSQRARDIAVDLFELPFDLSSPPLARLACIRTTAGSTMCVFVTHHAVCDGWSCAIMLSDLIRFHDLFRAGLPLQIPPPPVEYKEWVVGERKWLESPAAHEHIAYWQRRPHGATWEFALPADRIRPADISRLLPPTRGSVDGNVVGLLRAFCKVQRVTLFVCVAVAYAIALARWACNPSVLFWIFHTGRSLPEHASIVGMLAERWLMRISLPEAGTVSDALKVARAMQLEAMPHIRVPARVVTQQLRASGLQPPDSIFSYLPWRPAQTGLPFRPVDLNLGRGRFDPSNPFSLAMNVFEQQESLRWSIQHNCGRFEDESIERLSSSFKQILERIANAPEEPISALLHRA
jgi:hypothetical protein